LLILLSKLLPNAWTVFIIVTSVLSLPCYLFATLYLLKLMTKKQYPAGLFAGKGQAWLTGVMSTIYAIWLLYAAGLKYLMLACIAYAVGIALYAFARHEHKEKLFPQGFDKVMGVIVIVLGIVGLIYGIKFGFN
jgi:arginine:ornithine antiporter/lysine permease